MGQLARFYSPMLVPYLVAILLLTVREQLHTLVETGQCVMFHTALSAGAKPYYILPTVKMGARVLGYVQAEIILCRSLLGCLPAKNFQQKH